MSNIVFTTIFLVIIALGCGCIIMTNNVQEWLKYAVAIAEKDLGAGTGQLKLRQVYNMFIEIYPAISKIIPFQIFSKWVDLALEWLKGQLEQNKAVVGIINNAN